MTLKQTGKFYALLTLAVGCLSLFGQPTSSPPASATTPLAVTEPAYVPVRNIASLLHEWSNRSLPTNELVHVRGAILDQRVGEYLAIRDETGTILAVSPQTPTVKMQTVVDVWGVVSESLKSRLH